LIIIQSDAILNLLAREPGDYDAPTCAACHMSGIGELSSTHNVNERLTRLNG
jgi:hypothetical protein